MTSDEDDRFGKLFAGEAGSVLGAEREKLVYAKKRWASEARLITGEPDIEKSRRLPPGQQLTNDWPVLDLGTRPAVPLDQWQLTVGGAVANPLKWDWNVFMSQPQTESVSDIHCVTQWSRYDNRWTGVAARHLLAMAQPRDTARHVVFHGHDGYTTNVRLEQFAAEDVILAHSWQGEPISREHGGPMRPVIPALYFWKSAKWVRHIAILEKPVSGFWETRGYHDNGDPWREERYG